MRRRWLLIAVVSLMASLAWTSTAAAESKTKGKYKNVEVMRFDVQEGVNFPADFLVTMMEELVSQLQETKKFGEVLRQGETPKDEGPAVKLMGTVTRYDKGNRAMRYMVGFGAGKTKIVAEVKFLDRTTNEVVFQKKVDGRVWIGFVGGESIGATRGLAKEVAKVAKEQLS